MYDRHGMLAERFALGRQVFMETQLTRPVPQRRPGSIRVLVVGDPKFSPQFKRRPQQLPGARDEAQKVVNKLELLNKQLGGMPKIEVTKKIGEELKAFELRELLRGGEYDIVHYAGHAYFDQKSPEASAWILSDGPLRAQEIRNTLDWSNSPPWLVYANACEAGMDGQRARDRYHGNVFGLATAFINNGVAAYVAPLWPVDDSVAAFLAEQFYESLLLDRASLGESLWAAKCAAKRELLDSTKPEDDWALPASTALSWASVVLYGDPTPRLLQSLWTPGAATKQPTE
jgi:CHAT domain-containing protein